MSNFLIGIIANPASGKDIRRIVSFASTSTNLDKVNSLRRVLSGLESSGTLSVVCMPDPWNLVENARPRLGGNAVLRVTPIDMEVRGSPMDTSVATEKMVRMGVAAIIVVGGDGTNRLVAKGSGAVPLVPIPTGRNNIFFDFLEGTKAGLAAGVLGKFPVLERGEESYVIDTRCFSSRRTVGKMLLLLMWLFPERRLSEQ